MGRDGLLGAFEELVLLAVARGRGTAYGMTVRREIEDRSGRAVTIGAVYATLDRLQSKGLVASSFVDSDSGAGSRARRLFTIRPLGVEALAGARRLRAPMWEGLDLDTLVVEPEGSA